MLFFLFLFFIQEELIRLVGEYIDKARVAFPRLFFLSDNDLLSLLAWSRNPKDLLPFVRKCFPGIKNLQFALPKDGNLRLNPSLDTALNGNFLSQNILRRNQIPSPRFLLLIIQYRRVSMRVVPNKQF